MPGFSIDVAHDGPVCVIAISGELDIEHADDLAGVGALAAESLHTTDLIVDLANVPFLDSTGLGALIQICNTARDSGKTVTLRGAQPRVQKVIAITGVASVFGLVAASPEPG